jgi:hypothetical protein
LINLTYAIDEGTNWNDTYKKPGTVHAPNLSCYIHNQTCPGALLEEVSQSMAHSYGELTLSSTCGSYNDTSDILKSWYNYRYYCRRTRDRQEFAYRFSEYNPDDKEETYPFFTDRIITASSGPCFEYSEVGASPGFVANQYPTALNYEYTNGSISGNTSIPLQSGALNGTTYIYRGIDIPQRATTYACGPRCIWMWAHRNFGAGQESAFY